MSDTKKIDYDDILAGMNLFVENGQLRIVRGTQSQSATEPTRIELGPKDDPEPEKKKLTEEEEKERYDKYLKELHEEQRREIVRLRGIREAKTRKIRYINNYPAQTVENSPHRVETIFSLKFY